MEYYVGLDVSLKQTAICVVDGDCEVVWQGCADTHPEMILSALDRWVGEIARLGLETGSITPWLARALKARGLPVIVMDARRASDAMKARPVKPVPDLIGEPIGRMRGRWRRCCRRAGTGRSI